MTTPFRLLGKEMHTDPSRPLVTSYDETLGARVELSVATVANWVAKLGNAFADEWAIGPGDQVAVDLPVHWAGVVIVLAVWAAGGEVADAAADTPYRVRIGNEPELNDTELVLTLEPMGADLSRLVAGSPDTFPGAADGGSEVVARALALGLPEGARVISTLPFDRLEHAVRNAAAPLAVGGSIVLVTGAEPQRLEQIAAVERAVVPGEGWLGQAG